MVEFGLLTDPTKDILSEIKTIKKLGFDFVEIAMEWPEGASEILDEKRSKILHLLKKYKLFAIGHTAWWMDFSSPYDFVRKGWVEEGKKKIDLAKRLGIKEINFHSHSILISPFRGKYKKAILNNFVKSLKSLMAYAKSRDIEVMLENSVERGEITDFNDFKYIVDKTNVKVHLDVGHAFVSGGMGNIENYIFNFRNKIEHIHFHDNHGMGDEHLPIGEGLIDFDNVVKYLKKIGYDKTITFEVFTNRSDARKSMLTVKKMWQRIK
jgi:sugar phosphate isomerase/epimerase